MKQELEQDIRELSRLFADNVEAMISTPINERSPEQIEILKKRASRAHELETKLSAELGIADQDEMYTTIIDFVRKEGSDAAEPLALSIAFVSAFWVNIGNAGVPKGTCATPEVIDEAMKQTRQQFEAPSSP